MSRRPYRNPLLGSSWFADDWPTDPRPRRHPVSWPDPRHERRPPAAEPAPTPIRPAEPVRVHRGPEALTPTAPEPERTDVDPDKQRLRDALRELEQARARVERDAERVADQTRRDLVEQLLPVLDNLDRSMAAAVAAGEDSPLRDGVELVRAQFEKVLLGYGVEKLETVGHRFDPSEHDAVAVIAVADRDRDGVVVDEWQPGYRIGDRILRAAKVRVGKLAA